MSRVLSLLAGGLLVQQPTTSTSAQTTGAAALGISGNQAIALIVVFGAAFLLVWLVPLLIDTWRAYRLRSQVVALIEKDVLKVAGRDGLTLQELRAVLATLGRPATGQSGLNRALMALTITSAVGVALLFLLLTNSTAAIDLAKTALTALVGVLATIVGFYFGTRAGEPTAPSSPAEPLPPSPPPPPPPQPSPAEPERAAAEPETAAAAEAAEELSAGTAEPAAEVPPPPPESVGGPAEAPVEQATTDQVPFDRQGDFEAEPEPEAEPERPPFDVDKELEGKEPG